MAWDGGGQPRRPVFLAPSPGLHSTPGNGLPNKKAQEQTPEAARSLSGPHGGLPVQVRGVALFAGLAI